MVNNNNFLDNEEETIKHNADTINETMVNNMGCGFLNNENLSENENKTKREKKDHAGNKEKDVKKWINKMGVGGLLDDILNNDNTDEEIKKKCDMVKDNIRRFNIGGVE